MKKLNHSEYRSELQRIKDENLQKKYRLSLKAEKNKYKSKGLETSKVLAIYLFVLLNVIIIYAMTAMWFFADLNYLGVLISDIAAQVLIYAIYCLKAYNGKKQEESMKFKRQQYADSFKKLLEAGSCESEYIMDDTLINDLEEINE